MTITRVLNDSYSCVKGQLHLCQKTILLVQKTVPPVLNENYSCVEGELQIFQTNITPVLKDSYS